MWQPPETHVAWREEVEKLQPKYENDDERREREAEDRKALAKLAEKLLDDFPLKPHELLQDRMTRVRETLAKLPDSPAWVVDEDGGLQFGHGDEDVEIKSFGYRLVPLK